MITKNTSPTSLVPPTSPLAMFGQTLSQLPQTLGSSATRVWSLSCPVAQSLHIQQLRLALFLLKKASKFPFLAAGDLYNAWYLPYHCRICCPMMPGSLRLSNRDQSSRSAVLYAQLHILDPKCISLRAPFSASQPTLYHPNQDRLVPFKPPPRYFYMPVSSKPSKGSRHAPQT